MFDGTLRAATEKECNVPWSGSPKGLRFRCGLCGFRFKVGDLWRGVYANGSGKPCRGNFIVCLGCAERHGTDEKLIAARVAMVEEAGRFWWLMDDDDLKWIDKVRSEKP